MVLKNKSGVAYTEDLVIRVIIYGISGYHNDVPSGVQDKTYEITNGILNFITTVK